MHAKTPQLWSIGLKIHFLERVQRNTYTKDLRMESNSVEKIEWKHPLNKQDKCTGRRLEPSVTGGSKQLDFQSLVISINIHTFPSCLLRCS